MDGLLQGERVTLRRVGTDDVPQIYQAVRESLDALTPWLPWCHPQYSLRETESFVAKQIALWDAGEEFTWTIRAEDNLLAGMVGLKQFNRLHRVANLGYWLRSSRVGHGYATEASRLIAAFGIRELGLKRIEILVAVENLRSHGVAERLGGMREGILRSRLWVRDHADDAVCYSIVADDRVA